MSNEIFKDDCNAVIIAAYEWRASQGATRAQLRTLHRLGVSNWFINRFCRNDKKKAAQAITAELAKHKLIRG